MKDQLITFETAKLAKEKGFNEYCYNYWIDENTQTNEHYIGKLVKEFKPIPAPTQSLLQKWLREKHNIDVVISPERYYTGVNYLVQAQKWDLNADPEVKLNFVIKGSCWYNDNHEYPTYEEALEKGLQEALKLIEL